MNQKKQTICISLLLATMLQTAAISASAGSVSMLSNSGLSNAGLSNTSSVSSESASGSISDVYSDIDMRIHLATKAGAAPCAAQQCAENLAFDARVSAIGRYLSKAAIMVYPKQEQLIQRMVFSVAEKQDPGTASNNKGQIKVFRGVQNLQLSDDALGFVLAREMSHVIAGHHSTNTSTKLIISALASVLFPAVAIIGASSTAAQASTATTLLTSAASTATSMVGGEVAMAKMKPTQLSQADEIARNIMDKADWDMRSAQSVLLQADAPKGAWLLDLEVSRLQLAKLGDAEDAQITPLVGDFELEQIANQSADEVSFEALAEQSTQTQMQTNEELEQVEEILLKSEISSDAETDGIKITPLPASIDAASKASL